MTLAPAVIALHEPIKNAPAVAVYNIRCRGRNIYGEFCLISNPFHQTLLCSEIARNWKALLVLPRGVGSVLGA